MPCLAIGIAGPVDEPDRNVDADDANVVGTQLAERLSDMCTNEDAVLDVDRDPTPLETVHASSAHGDECSGARCRVVGEIGGAEVFPSTPSYLRMREPRSRA
jgi:hypothetical protein